MATIATLTIAVKTDQIDAAKEKLAGLAQDIGTVSGALKGLSGDKSDVGQFLDLVELLAGGFFDLASAAPAAATAVQSGMTSATATVGQFSVAVATASQAVTGLQTATAGSAPPVRNLAAGFEEISKAIGGFSSRSEDLKDKLIPLYETQKKLAAQTRELSDLEKVGALSKDEAARATWELGQKQKEANKAQQIADEIYQNNGKNIRLTSEEMGKLGGALKGMGQSFLETGKPLDALMSQLPALGETFVSAAMHGGSLKGALSSIGGALGETLGIANPVGLAIAGTVAVVAGGFALAANELNRTGESAAQVQKRLGLTAEEVKNAGGAAVTMGDVMHGVFKTIADAVGPMLGKAIDWIKDRFVDWFQTVVKLAEDTVGGLIGLFLGAFNAVQAVWKLLPAAIGDAAISTANAVIDGVTSMINTVIEKANVLISAANKAAKAVHIELNIPELKPVTITRLQNQYAGAMAEVGKAAGQGMAKGLDDGRAMVKAAEGQIVSVGKGVVKAVVTNTYSERDGRLTRGKGDQAQGGGGGAGVRGGGDSAASGPSPADAAEDYQKLIDAGQASIDTMTKQTALQAKYNNLVASGSMTVDQAAQALKQENEIQKYIDAETEARKNNQIALADELLAKQAALTKATQAQTAAEADKAVVAMGADQQKQLDQLREELTLVGKTNAERTEALAVYKAEQELKAKGYNEATATDAERQHAADVIANARAIVQLQEQLKTETDKANGAAKDQLDLMKQASDEAQKAAQGLAAAFDGVSDSLKKAFSSVSSIIGIMSKLAEKEKDIAKQRADDLGGLDKDSAKYKEHELRWTEESAKARVGAYGDMASAAKGFFKEGTGGYKVMQAAEIAFRAIEMVMSIKAMAQSTVETASSVKDAAVKAEAHGVVAYAHALAALPPPFNFAAAAVVLAALAAVGVAITGGGGGSVPGEHDAEKRQKAQGAGSVLGDAEAKSESIQKALDLVADHTNTMLEFYNPMLSALRSIDSQISNLASALARSLGVGGMLSTEGLKLGTSGTAPALSNLGFGSVTKRTLQDQGLQFMAGTLGAILSGGVQGKTYQQILSETKKSAFGLTYSTSTSKKTVLGALDPEFAKQTTLLIGSLRDGVVSAASVLGIEGAAATLDAFKLDLGKISLKDLKGEEITKALEAVFGKAADQMAAAVMPGLDRFQKVGEGAFETLTRLARDYQVVDVTLKSIGKVFGAVGVASVEARERLVELSGGLDNFTDQASFYAENFLTEAERLAPVQAAVRGELARLGLTGVKTRDQFKAVVQGLDVSTQAGAELYAALMTLAPAFAAVTEESQALSDAKDALSSAYERESGALQDTHDRFADLAKSLHDFGAGLYKGPAAALSPEEQYRAAQAAFQETAGLAAQGNEQALGDLQNVSQAYLDASRAYYASSEGYFADLAAVRDAVAGAEANATGQADVAQRQLDTMTEQVGQLIELNTHVVSVAEAIAALRALMGGKEGSGSLFNDIRTPTGGSASNDNTAVVTAIQDLQTEVSDQLAADKTQRAAIAQQQDERLSAVEEQLAALRRAAQA